MTAVGCPTVADWLAHLIAMRSEGLEIRVRDQQSSYGFEAEGAHYLLHREHVRDMYTWFDTVEQQGRILAALDLSLGNLVNILSSVDDRRAWFDNLQ